VIKSLPATDQLTFNVVRLVCALGNGGQSIGTGFLFDFANRGDQSVPCIVTNYHVVDGAQKAEVCFHLDDGSGMPARGKFLVIAFDELPSRIIRHPDHSVDLCAIPVGTSFNKVLGEGHRPIYIGLDANVVATPTLVDSLTAVEDVIMVGYPIGLWDSTNNLPIVRRGITATHPAVDFCGKKEFLIDAACFPGSSGSPVFLFNQGSYVAKTGGLVIGSRMALLGVLYAGPQFTAQGTIEVVDIPTAQSALVRSSIPANMGLVIKASRVLELDSIVADLQRAFEAGRAQSS
jgi:hypothetical protein